MTTPGPQPRPAPRKDGLGGVLTAVAPAPGANPAGEPAKPQIAAWPVVEVFGPTVQGEGQLAGVPTHFIRFGGCDYHCSWCDSLYAVVPAEWKDAPRLSALEITNAVADLGDGPRWVTLTGGNPAIHDLTTLCSRLHEAGYRVTVETQGSRWRPWLVEVDHLTISPKPPSSGMTKKHDKKWRVFLDSCVRTQRYTPATSIKIVIFDDADLEWARGVLDDGRKRHWPLYLSVGTDQGLPAEETKQQVITRYAWLCDRVKGDAAFSDVAVLPQLHVLAWGVGRGV